MAARSTVNWLAVRTYYFSAPTISYPQCSDKFGVSTRSIETKASKEGWVEERRRIFGDAEAQLREQSTKDAINGLAIHAQLADALAEAVRIGLEEIRSMPAGRSKAETIKVYAEAADKAVRLGRDVRGITQGKASIDDPEKSATRRLIFEEAAESLEETA